MIRVLNQSRQSPINAHSVNMHSPAHCMNTSWRNYDRKDGEKQSFKQLANQGRKKYDHENYMNT